MLYLKQTILDTKRPPTPNKSARTTIVAMNLPEEAFGTLKNCFPHEVRIHEGDS